MVLNDFRKVADLVVVPISKPFMKLDPNQISLISFIFAILAGLSFFLSKWWGLSIFGEADKGSITVLLILGSLFVIVSGLFDVIDGKVARMTNRVTKRGDFLDHVLDRYSDCIILMGLSFSDFCVRELGMLAIISILIVSYLGTQSQALGCGRNYSGIMGRAERIVVIIFFPVFHLIYYLIMPGGYLPIPSGVWGVMGLPDIQLTLIDLLMIILIVGANLSALQRAWMTWKELTDMEKKERAGKKTRPKEEDEDQS